MEAASAESQYRSERQDHWDGIARSSDRFRGLGGGYHRRLARVYRTLVPPGKRVLELGCGRGDLLAALEPSCGVGVDFSAEMISRASRLHPDLLFVRGDAHELAFSGTFDYVVLSDLISDVWDVQAILEGVSNLCTASTRIVINSYSRVWELPLVFAGGLRLSNRRLQQNWFTLDDARTLLRLADLEIVRTWSEVVWPLRTPLIDDLANQVLVRIPPLNHLALTNFFVARPRNKHPSSGSHPIVSVIVPARNEAGNIEQIIRRVPEMEGGTELVFVEGNSTDDTFETIETALKTTNRPRCSLMRQDGKGKGDAVRKAFAHAQGDILMILDADMTVAPEDLPRFCRALVTGKCEFVNGVRLVYPMEKRAMRLANLAGNKFFSMAFSWLLGQPVRDTLCGTKVLWKHDYDAIARNRGHFGDFDPFGDFDLLFGAARLNLKIQDMPIRYRERTYGDTNIQRWRHGLILLRMMVYAGRKLKFV